MSSPPNKGALKRIQNQKETLQADYDLEHARASKLLRYFGGLQNLHMSAGDKYHKFYMKLQEIERVIDPISLQITCLKGLCDDMEAAIPEY